MTTVTTTNDYWEAVRAHLHHDGLWGGDVVDTYGSLRRDHELSVDRFALCGQYSWTITDPDSVAFVLDRCGPIVVDPLAGSGWWAHLLAGEHVRVYASDLNPPDGTDANHWHQTSSHLPIARSAAVQAVQEVPVTATLLLSWPPYATDAGCDALAAYPGNRVIYMGEGDGGCCGTDALFELFESGWNQVAVHRPVQYYGIHDYITVYDRKEPIR